MPKTRNIPDTHEKGYSETMTVTEVKEYNQRKVLVQLDGHLTFPLYKGEIGKYRISVGAELSAECVEELLQHVLPKRVKLRAMALLQKRSYTTEGLRRKLLEGGYPAGMTEDAIDYVASYGYLDDDRYADEYIRCYSQSKSKRRIFRDLYAKGVSETVAAASWHRYEQYFEPIDEKTQIAALLRKKQYDPDQTDYKEKVRIMNYLYRKGYSSDSIHEVFANLQKYTKVSP